MPKRAAAQTAARIAVSGMIGITVAVCRGGTPGREQAPRSVRHHVLYPLPGDPLHDLFTVARHA
jgi:hypothetical protein